MVVLIVVAVVVVVLVLVVVVVVVVIDYNVGCLVACKTICHQTPH